MQKSALESMLEPIARSRSISSTELRLQMRRAMEEAMENPDPKVQAMWRSIPKKGDKPSLEEFMEYLIDRKLLSPR